MMSNVSLLIITSHCLILNLSIRTDHIFNWHISLPQDTYTVWQRLLISEPSVWSEAGWGLAAPGLFWWLCLPLTPDRPAEDPAGGSAHLQGQDRLHQHPGRRAARGDAVSHWFFFCSSGSTPGLLSPELLPPASLTRHPLTKETTKLCCCQSQAGQ